MDAIIKGRVGASRQEGEAEFATNGLTGADRVAALKPAEDEHATAARASSQVLSRRIIRERRHCKQGQGRAVMVEEL